MTLYEYLNFADKKPDWDALSTSHTYDPIQNKSWNPQTSNWEEGIWSKSDGKVKFLRVRTGLGDRQPDEEAGDPFREGPGKEIPLACIPNDDNLTIKVKR